MTPSLRFIPPAVPTRGTAPPTGPTWLHEIKWDGWRVQIHKSGKTVTLYSRNGADITSRFRSIAAAAMKLATPAAIIDAEIVALANDGTPDFVSLHRRKSGARCVVAFDLMHVASTDITAKPLSERRRRLRALLHWTAHPSLNFSEDFPDPVALLAELE